VPDPSAAPPYRALEVPAVAGGYRLDRFLALRFADWSRTALARAIRAGQVTNDAGVPLRASHLVQAGQVLHLTIPGIAPAHGAPPLPPILHEDDRVIALAKPPGLLCHPAGTAYAWAVIGLARERWPDSRVDLVHRLDRDTSGVLLLTRDVEANRFLKAALHDRETYKAYVAIVKHHPPWDARTLDGPIGPAEGPVRIQMAVRPDGLSARTDVTVLERHPSAPLARVHCRIHTGRTHQIRVHLANAGHPVLGDRIYGVPPEVFLRWQEEGETAEGLAQAGASRHALHAAELTVPHPDGGELRLTAPEPEDLTAWWQAPTTLPWDGLSTPPR
jgi:23S rRNA pseudouridine1911/1915/1917 synthase